MNISKRAFARILTFSAALILTLAAFAVIYSARAAKAQRAVETGYLRAIEELSSDLDNIKNDLQKGMYTNSVSMLSDLSAKMCSNASSAKNALSQLPVEELDLSAAYRFLSQVGNYSKALAEKCARGQQLTEEENSNLAALYRYAAEISRKMWEVEDRVERGEITFTDVIDAASSLETSSPVTVTDGFTDFATSENDCPSLIYDGPYSDHIMEKQPLMLIDEDKIDENEALRRAKKLAGDNLTLSAREGGKMPSYIFTGSNTTVAVTEAGGMYSYMLSHRAVGQQVISAEAAVSKAVEFMSDIGIRNITDSYYEIRNGVCIINLAAQQNGVTMYTDLIKVGVALDNGDILSFDMRGYLTNHTIRDLPAPRISAQRAQTLVSGRLSVLGTKLCVIPSAGQNELFCYEVKCVGANGENILVYVNAVTGHEEEILILKIGANGVLTV